MSSFFYKIYYLKEKKICSWKFHKFYMPTVSINKYYMTKHKPNCQRPNMSQIAPVLAVLTIILITQLPF